MSLSILILAAGQGTRMKSDLPKVLQPLAGRTLLRHVYDCATVLGADAIHVVYGHGGETVKESLPDDVNWVLQAEQLGTGHAVQQAMPHVTDDQIVLVLYGDVPLIRATTLESLVAASGDGSISVLTVALDDPTGYGRIVRNASGQVIKIVEQKDADPEEQQIHEVNTGLIACPGEKLRGWLEQLKNDNSQGEYYLTDIIELAVADGVPVHPVAASSTVEVQGINTKAQLAEVEAAHRRLAAEQLMHDGATLADPSRIDVRGTVEVGRDVFIDIDVVFEGNVRLDDRVKVGPFCHLKDVEIRNDTEIKSHTSIDTAHIGPRCMIGPFARVRPETYLGSEAKIGNFVEVKKATIAKGSKVNHLSYVGDAKIGKNVNIGAGTITCNYDGANKHVTEIDDDVFVGSGTQLVAPVKIGAGATIGAGSVITKDAPDGALTVSRAKQMTLDGWQRPEKGPKNQR